MSKPSSQGESSVSGKTSLVAADASTPSAPTERPSNLDSSLPQGWSKWKKWPIIACASVLNFLDATGASASATAIPAILKEFGFDAGGKTVVTLTVSVYVLGVAVGPLIVAPLSERYGRLWFYLGANALFIVCNIACALSTNIGMLIGFRALTGCVGAAPAAIGAGTIADLMVVEDRTLATAIFASGVIIGPTFGPIAGGLITAAAGWRWIFWGMAIAAGAVLGPCILFMRETHVPTILRRQSRESQASIANGMQDDQQRLPRGNAWAEFSGFLLRPMVMLFSDWAIFLASIYSAVADAYMFILLTTFAETFMTVYGFSTAISGLAYLGLGIGAILGQVIHFLLSDRTVRFHKARGDYRPEYRLLWMPVGSLTMPLGFFWYGWTVEKNVHWIVPIIGSSLCGMGSIIVMVGPIAYLIDAYTEYAASAIAAMVITRAIIGAFLPLVAFPLYGTLGQGWGNSLLAFIGLTLAPIPLLMFVYGERIRNHSRKRNHDQTGKWSK